MIHGSGVKRPMPLHGAPRSAASSEDGDAEKRRAMSDVLLYNEPLIRLLAFAGIFALLVLQAAFIYWPPLRSIFGAAALDAASLGRATAVAFVIWPLISIEKAWRRRALLQMQR